MCHAKALQLCLDKDKDILNLVCSLDVGRHFGFCSLFQFWKPCCMLVDLFFSGNLDFGRHLGFDGSFLGGIQVAAILDSPGNQFLDFGSYFEFLW